MTREEALEIIKRNCTLGSDLRKACELFIPELTESEDEKVRKELIDMISECTNWVHKKKYIAYLKKQPTEEMLRTLRVEYEKGVAEQKLDLTVKGNGVYKICPHCKSRMIRDESKVYTSIPPQYGYNCPKCGTMEFDTVMYDNPELEEQKPAEVKVVYPDNPKRKEIGFYYNKKEVSWEDMLLADRMHDYPYYFRDGMDYYPFMPEQKPAKKDDIGYVLGRGNGMETHEKNWKTAIMTLEEAITHCNEKACGNTQCALEHKQLAEWLEELKEYRKNAGKEESK